MARKFSKCNCNEFVRDEDKDFLLTVHHPECKQFNPASELHGLEMQCKHFMNIILELKTKVKELKHKLHEVDSILCPDEDEHEAWQ
jgi:hypothetical protein